MAYIMFNGMICGSGEPIVMNDKVKNNHMNRLAKLSWIVPILALSLSIFTISIIPKTSIHAVSWIVLTVLTALIFSFLGLILSVFLFVKIKENNHVKKHALISIFLNGFIVCLFCGYIFLLRSILSGAG